MGTAFAESDVQKGLLGQKPDCHVVGLVTIGSASYPRTCSAYGDVRSRVLRNDSCVLPCVLHWSLAGQPSRAACRTASPASDTTPSLLPRRDLIGPYP